MYNKPVKVNSSVLASRLKSRREYCGVSKAAMAHALNITPSSMTYYESGLALPSIDKLYAIADYLGTSIDYLVGRIDKSIESVKTEKDVADLIVSLTGYEGIDLKNNADGTPVIAFESEIMNDFLQNRIEIEQLKEEASAEAIPERFFNQMFKSKRMNETYYLRDLDDRTLTLKDGSDNAAIRRKRRLSDESDEAVAAETVSEKKNKNQKPKPL